MRTLLSQFCDSFDEVVRPILEPLTMGAEALLTEEEEMPGREVRADILDLRHQFEALVHKVSEQQAYVLLFGPLKSGKSTLMNAIAHQYVSEVSSLPAYPCMVFVSHGETRCFDVTRYSGRSERFTDPTALHLFINRAHTELAERIRAAEDQGEVFDPALHYPEAIRRVDVRLPAAELAESGAVLVDTPGLYARMRFGYSQMTRDFRDAASCAIFVVKSDNLFLEQVFEEFEDLLGLFSRIFLVVNLDSAKRDLAPDGRLVPSLEQEDPLRIIDAFESLAMSAPLKRAAEEGRLKLYPVDLLRAASARLSGDDAPEARQGLVDFEAFQKDLTDYLNSTEYLVAFLGDSLRRAKTLLGEAEEIARHPQAADLKRSTDALETDRRELSRRLTATQRLQGEDWKRPFQELGERLLPEVEAEAARIGQEAEQKLVRLVDSWFQTQSSLQSLLQEDLIGALHAMQLELAESARGILQRAVREGTAGVLLPTEAATDLAAAEVDANAIGREMFERVASPALPRPGELPIVTSQIPVKKGILDWLLLRSIERVRMNLFGHPGAPALRITVDVKQRRLGAPAREAMTRLVRESARRLMADATAAVHRQAIQQYGDLAAEAILDALRLREAAMQNVLQGLNRRITARQRVLRQLALVGERAVDASASIEQLSEEYGAAEPERLIQPVQAPEGTLPTIPAGGPLGSEPVEESEEPAGEGVPAETDAESAGEGSNLPRVHPLAP